jgi:hypothetical protein
MAMSLECFLLVIFLVILSRAAFLNAAPLARVKNLWLLQPQCLRGNCLLSGLTVPL